MESETLERRAVYADLAGRRVAITGAGAGIGRAMALAFAGQGARLVLNDLDASALGSVEAEVRELGAEVVSTSGSIVDNRPRDAFFTAAGDAFGGVDVLVNNAGISMNVPTLELKRDDWERCLDINLTVPFLCAQAVVPAMSAARRGVILNLASMYGVVAAPERLAYCATKSALAMMTKVMAIEWAERGIRANALAPGYVRTDLVERLVTAGRMDADELIARTPLNRLATPDEIADLALFLASDASAYITGQVVGVDGGWTAYGYV